ncbi:type II toxin-antitoxin system HicA family toxin [Thorsellia anophelis]|uniref:HicA toxin of toxin-antitoxin n=1 Tax=Thorsellia anophelis DSM 18579 TaxID=1123402 RepID=A0A1I0FW79_9GAMM|nr:type II toxin-antitoxin system HicA family toxin [Thorsellia anophelis]SET61919.1 HicA toxin of toxin-antitoxin [Thorsellia anophelis DSM 18579]
MLNFLKQKLTPLTYQEVVAGLTELGFEMLPKKATGHEQWRKVDENTKFLVTVSKHSSPFSKVLIQSIAKQAGLKSREFHALCKKQITLIELKNLSEN